MNVDVDKIPDEGEVLIVTPGGSFSVKGSMAEIAGRLAEEEWPQFVLSGSGDSVAIRSAQVVAVRGSSSHKRGSIGFVAPHE